jgi:predicted acetyltransferase
MKTTPFHNDRIKSNKICIQINLSNTPVELEERLKEFTKEEQYCNFKVSLIRNGSNEHTVYLKYLDSNFEKVKLSNGLVAEHEYFTREFDKIIHNEFKLDWMCD